MASRIFLSLLIVIFHRLKTSTAIYRSVVRRLEDNFRNTAAISASRFKVFTRSFSCVFLCITASLAALGLIGEALLLVEFLLSGSENKLVSTLLADKSFIYKLRCSTSYYFFVHDCFYLALLDLPRNIWCFRGLYMDRQCLFISVLIKGRF